MTGAAGAPAWEEREDWLSLLGELFDPATIERLEDVGVEPGSEVLEVGAGSGSIAIWLARAIGPDGRVTATDIDTRFLDAASEEPNLEVHRHDLEADSFPAESFDLIHVRAVLVHIADGARALERMVGWLKPGGVLLCEEPWIEVGAIASDPAMSLLAEALAESVDETLAARLPMVMRDAGLEEVNAEGKMVFFEGRSRLARFNQGALGRQLDRLVETGKIDREAGERMLAKFDDPSWSAWSRPMLAAWGRRPASTRPQVAETARGAVSAADAEQSIGARFSQQVSRDPGRTAIVGRSWRPSYAELDAAANRIAEHVLAHTEEEDARVGLLLGHDSPLFAAALGTLKAGRTVVVMNPVDPPVRLARIHDQVEPQLVIADEPNRERALAGGAAADSLLTLPERPDDAPHAAPEVPIDPGAVAFVVFTSGSTGEPKGVMQTHRNVLHNALRQGSGLGVVGEDRIAMLSPFSAGQGLGVASTTLLNGATLLPFPAVERGVAGLADWIDEQRASMLTLPASVYRHFVRGLDGRRFEGIRLVRLGSEPAMDGDFEAFRRHFAESCRFANLLSSTETGNITQSLFSADSEVRPGGLSVGRPAEGIEVLLLDEGGTEVSAGEVGQLAVRSPYLSPGYWHEEENGGGGSGFRTANDGSRVFHTGDLARADRDGSLTVLGRRDDRIKIRGNRVELAEVRAALAAEPEVVASAVLPGRTRRGETRLTGFVVLREGEEIGVEDFAGRMRQRLPRHAVPSALVVLDRLPLDANGKLDSGELAELAEGARRRPSLEPPRGAVEEALARIWADVFELDRVGRDDDFFDLDGDSLLAAEVSAEVASAFGLELELDAFSEARTVASMARLVEELREGVAPGGPPQDLARVPRDAPPPASFAQERMWREAQRADSMRFVVATAVRISGPLDVDLLRRSLDEVVRRHETLRTTFAELDGRLVQVIHPPDSVELPLIEPADGRAAVPALLDQQCATPFDLEQGPLLRFQLVRISPDEHTLIRCNDHIISDRSSWDIFFDDLGQIYDAYHRGEPSPLDELPLQFADFAAWERSAAVPGSSRYEGDLDWWRRELQGVETAPSLPFERPSMTPADASEGFHEWWVRPGVSRRLDRLARESGATFYMVRLALFSALLAVETERFDPILMLLSSNRGPKGLRRVFGPLFSPTFLRVRLDPRSASGIGWRTFAAGSPRLARDRRSPMSTCWRTSAPGA